MDVHRDHVARIRVLVILCAIANADCISKMISSTLACSRYESEQIQMILLLDALNLFEFSSQKLKLPYVVGRFNSDRKFDIEKMSNSWCIEYLRFEKDHVIELAELLKIPSTFRYKYRAKPTTALAVLLFRLSYPQRLKQAMEVFHHERGWLSTIFNDVCNYLNNRYEQRQFWDEQRLTSMTLTNYCNAIQAHGEPSGKIWGFIDGTHKFICRPKKNVADQRYFYSGYKKDHTMVFQGVTTPDGLISSISGPFEGRMSDWGIWVESKLQNKLLAHAFKANGEEIFLYGDGAYTLQRGILGSYRAAPNTELSAQQKFFNTSMSRRRICVEWSFGKVSQLWGYTSYKRGMKLGLSPVGTYYRVAIFLTNCHTCYYGSNTSMYFKCAPPTIHDYLNL